MADRTWTIMAVARRFGVPRHLIRHFEAAGLVQAAQGRKPGGWRRYDAQAVRRIGIMAALHKAGLRTGQIAKALDALDAGDVSALQSALRKARDAATMTAWRADSVLSATTTGSPEHVTERLLQIAQEDNNDGHA